MIGITFKAGQHVYYFVRSTLVNVSNLYDEDLLELKKSFVESYKRLWGIHTVTEWIY